MVTAPVLFLVFSAVIFKECSGHDEEHSHNTTGLVSSNYQLPCRGACRNTQFYWCDTARGWDFCSPGAGKDQWGRKCTSKCENQGYNYNWCQVTGGSPNWGYCMVDEDDKFDAGSVNQGGDDDHDHDHDHASGNPCYFAKCPQNSVCEVKDGKASCRCFNGRFYDGSCQNSLNNPCNYAKCPMNTACRVNDGGAASCVCLEPGLVYRGGGCQPRNPGLPQPTAPPPPPSTPPPKGMCGEVQCVKGEEFCTSILGELPPTCKPKKPGTGKCKKDEECRSNHCNFNIVCRYEQSPVTQSPATTATDGGMCGAKHCVEGKEFCSSILGQLPHTCKPKLSGGSCSKNEECLSDNCFLGLACIKPQPPAETTQYPAQTRTTQSTNTTGSTGGVKCGATHCEEGKNCVLGIFCM